jgi:ATP-dependent DNA helicase RecG
MFLRSLNIPVNAIEGINVSAVSKLTRLGLRTVSDLLHNYPRDWEDRSKIVPLKEFQNSVVCTPVTVIAREVFGYGSTKRMKVYIDDGSTQAQLMCFNLNKRPWIEKQLIVDSKHLIYGKFKYYNGMIQSASFNYSALSSIEKFSRILPVYPLTSGLKQGNIRNYIEKALAKYADDIENELPDFIMERYNLLSKKDAIKEIHFPTSVNKLERAKKSLIYEELFYLEVMVIRRAFERKKNNICTLKEKETDFSPLQKKLLERLPFSLTNGQIEAVKTINQDMSSNESMARLLQGDVGSGKTLVSFLAALKACEKNAQTVIMAPTELLARQHAENAARLLEPLGIRIACLTGNIKAKGRRELLKNLASGDIDVIVGTHALFSRDVIYKNLKLAVIDEQHRFGVTQRSLIMNKGDSPDLLMMSATPIPRSLALTVFGDMDVCVIKDMPPGRKPIITHLAKESNEEKVYDFVRKELEKGKQAYFVYPLIEGSSQKPTEDIKDAVSMAERLSKNIFKEYKVALIHSKLPEEDKKKTMDDFRSGEIKILAATSVVEVGVDVPNATCMVIEHAELFGLSALHQLRGRVGRGDAQSYCFLIYSQDLTDDGKTRLKVMLESTDGFVIAEEDLKLRGPGQIAGIEQSGYLVLGISNPVRDIEELQRAREDVFSILKNDPDLLLANHQIIAKVLEDAPPFNEIAF